MRNFHFSNTTSSFSFFTVRYFINLTSSCLQRKLSATNMENPPYSVVAVYPTDRQCSELSVLNLVWMPLLWSDTKCLKQHFYVCILLVFWFYFSLKGYFIRNKTLHETHSSCNFTVNGFISHVGRSQPSEHLTSAHNILKGKQNSSSRNQ